MPDHFDSNRISLFLAWTGSIGVFLAATFVVFVPIAFFVERKRDEARWLPWFGVYCFLCILVISPLRYMMLQLLLSESYFVQSIGAATNSMYLMFYVPFVMCALYAVAIVLPLLPVAVLIERGSKMSALIATVLTPFAFAVGYALFFLLLPYAAWTIHWLPTRDVIRSANGPASVFHKLVVEPDIPRIGATLEIQEGDTSNERLRAHILATYISPIKQTKHHFGSSLFHIKQAI